MAFHGLDARSLLLRLSRARVRLLVRVATAIVIGQFLWALCLYVMGRARINFEFMLDLGPRTNTNAVIAASQAARTLIFYMCVRP